ncbi:O-fucosyltransferase 9 isoform X1 [Olea europaea subsp. europaea]|uniref:O-fucosyltransferase 9 isoform X1 n=1 Tax=Olea europaea subsp. europaea TaxID=158383 RepID=A0A8S0U771_OLEEU|nr:O-fucosyltransferase 9 isoform X1 [Olea europaea subsp. europaea]
MISALQLAQAEHCRLKQGHSSRWQDFKRQLQDMLRHSDVKGFELRKLSSSLYMYPTPYCMCRKADLKTEHSTTTKSA